MLDTYSLKARFYPVVILFFPLIIIGVSYSLHYENLIHVGSSLGLFGVLMYLFSQLGRDQGKMKENDLWNSWGGALTTQVLRCDNLLIDKHTRKRYHKKLQELCPIDEAPIADHEIENPGCNDEAYRAWTKFLISKTRDTKEFNLLFKENTSYGFRRNLWALKPLAVCILSVLFIMNYFFSVKEAQSLNPLFFNVEFWYSSFGLALIMIFWLAIVVKSWVRIPALAYGLRLCEAIDQLK